MKSPLIASPLLAFWGVASLGAATLLTGCGQEVASKTPTQLSAPAQVNCLVILN